MNIDYMYGVGALDRVQYRRRDIVGVESTRYFFKGQVVRFARNIDGAAFVMSRSTIVKLGIFEIHLDELADDIQCGDLILVDGA